MTEENGSMESSEDTNQNSIASSLLTLVEMITSAEQGGSLPANAQQVQVRPKDHYNCGQEPLIADDLKTYIFRYTFPYMNL